MFLFPVDWHKRQRLVSQFSAIFLETFGFFYGLSDAIYPPLQGRLLVALPKRFRLVHLRWEMTD
jgi:hypothetical protein